MSAQKIRVSAVKYANTFPFIYGLTETGFDKKIALTTDHPAECASKLISGKVDIGLIPVAALPLVREPHIITDFCLGAYGNVRTVLLLSNCSFEDIKTINLDYRSRSSVNLVKILAKNAWKREFLWRATDESFNFREIPENEGVVIIGDQCIELEKYFIHRIDLAGEWYRFTGLPFAFACWTANSELNEGFLKEFNEALAFGVNNIPDVVAKYGNSGALKGNDLKVYLTENMDFKLNKDKREAIQLFLDYMSKI